MIDREALLERFVRYVKIHTASEEESTSFPSSARQKDLSDVLVKELKEIGVKDVELDEHGYVYAKLPSNTDRDLPPVGFLAHVDTAPAESGENVEPLVHRAYAGGPIHLPGAPDMLITPDENPILNEMMEQDLITSNGTTLLGADDKAGVAEIMTAVEYLINNPDMKHGDIYICFTPDEEIGKGVDKFTMDKFPVKFAYTMDGGILGELEDETFCADAAEITFTGVNVHPGYAKDKMVNAIRMSSLFITKLNETTLPETTEHREMYYHATTIKGLENEVKLNMIIRSFTREGLKELEADLERIKGEVEAAFPRGQVKIDIKEQYRNMKEILDDHPEVLATALKAFEKAGIEPIRKPIRGGTDGARLTYMGIPTPNIFAGAVNMHGRKEFVSLQTMEKATEVILHIVSTLAEE